MSETSGFFVSQSGDRKYTPDWLAGYIKALVTTGVYSSELGVVAADGMIVNVAIGRAWIEGYLYLNDSPLELAIATADSALHRRDSVIVRLNMTERTITSMVLTGTYGTDPVAPAVTRTADVYDLKIAEVYVAAGTTKITQAMIKDTRLDDSVCGITVSAVQHIPTADYMAQMEAEFQEWFSYVQGILGEDEAGNLLDMIEDLQTSTNSEFTAVRKEFADADALKLTKPTTEGTAGQYLMTDGKGNYSWVTIKAGPTVHTGTTAPATSLGNDGDFYIKTK